MNDELTPREHDDMRDVLIAGAQRIRPAGSTRTRWAAGLAMVLVAGTIAAVTSTAFYSGRQTDPAADPTPTPTLTEEVQPTPIPGPGEVVQVPTGGTVTRLPAVLAPAPGTFLTLPPDPVLTVRVQIGRASWRERVL